MSEDELKEYIRNNLRVDVEFKSPLFESSTITVKLILDGEEIDTASTYIPLRSDN